MDRTILIGLIIILVLTLYYTYRKEENIEQFYWGFFRKAFRAVKRAPKKVFRVVKRSPRAVVRAIRNPKRTIRSVGRKVKKVGKKGLGTLSKIKNLTKKVSRLLKKIASLGRRLTKIKSLFKGLARRVKAAGALFKGVFGVTKEGFALLRSAIGMQISAAKMLYLVIDKMSKCNKGMKEVAKQYKKELDRIIGGLNNLHKRAFNCVTFKFGIGKNAYNNCIGYFFTIKDDLLNYQKRLDILLKNPKLFAQPTRTRYGQSKGYCVNTRSKSFRYSKSCNQCFNYRGILSRGKEELLAVRVLMRNSSKLFGALGKLRRTVNTVF